jgi:phage recombination protein Bet
MNDKTTAVVKRDEKAIEFTPYGSADKIKLSIAIVLNTVAVPTKRGRLPTERDAIKFMMLCQAQRLNPYAGDAYLVGYDAQDGPVFSLITAHQALLKRAEASDFFLGMESGIIVADADGNLSEIQGDFYTPQQEVVGGWAKVYHSKREKFPFYRRIRMERFNLGRAQWKVDAAGMICKCAEADALRSAFPTMLGGLYIAEEQTVPATITDSVEEITGKPRKPRPLAAPVAEQPAQVSNVRTPQQDLEAVVIEGGFDFATFTAWALESGNIPDADSLTMWDEVPTETAQRLLRAKTGLLAGLAAQKGGQ